jgi:enoyl-[acyl-carrier-protein] reductase (NADH)
MISPGPIKNMQNKILIKEIKSVTPMNRLGEYEDLFSLMKLLIEDGSKFITGQNIFVDGGRTII